MEHLSILQIVVPLLAAPLCVLIRKRSLVIGFSLLVCWATFVISISLMNMVVDRGAISYALGGWSTDYGIEYRVDALSAFVLLFVSGLGALVLTFAPQSLSAEVPKEKHYLFCTLYLLCLAGLLGITITGDLFNLFVFLEISSLSSYALISLGKTRRALSASLQYLVMGTVGATFILIGIGFMLSITGTLNMNDMAEKLKLVGNNSTVLVAFAFLVIGIGIKMALFPLHMWLPNAYAFAPSVVTAFLAATATKVSVYVFLRVVFTIFTVQFTFHSMDLDAVLMPLAVAGIFICSTVAIFQKDIKRMLAFSSVAQIGYMVVGICLVSQSGLTAGIVHLFNHALMKGGLFLAMGCIFFRVGSARLEDMQGLGKQMPVTMFAWVIGGLGLIGVPLTAGFISKWYLIQGAFESQSWILGFMLLMSSLLAVAYVWRVIETAYFKEPLEKNKKVTEAPAGMLIPTCVLIGATIYFGLNTSLSIGMAEKAAQVLLGGVQ